MQKKCTTCERIVIISVMIANVFYIILYEMRKKAFFEHFYELKLHN